MKNKSGIAFFEVLEVLKYVPKKDYDKIPNKIIDLMQSGYDENCDFKYNLALPFEEQEISDEAKAILGVIWEKYWKLKE